MGLDLDDTYWMALALQQAQAAALAGEVPVGAVLVDADNQLIASGYNQPIGAHDPTAHAEIQVLRDAAGKIGNYRLVDTTLYVTLEPCTMCVGAMIHARIGRLVFGASEPKTGAIHSAGRLLETITFNHRFEITAGILEPECASLISEFFSRRRAQKRAARRGDNVALDD